MKSQRRFAPISGRITPESVAVFTRIRMESCEREIPILRQEF